MFIFILINTHVDQQILLFLSFIEGLYRRRERESINGKQGTCVCVCIATRVHNTKGRTGPGPL